MFRMDFFKETAQTHRAEFGPVGEDRAPQVQKFMSDPARRPIQVEAVTVLLRAVRTNGAASPQGYLGKFHFALNFRGKPFDLDYDGCPSALELDTGAVRNSRKVKVDKHSSKGFSQAYTLGLAYGRSFVMVTGECAELTLTRAVDHAGVVCEGFALDVSLQLHSGMQLETLTERLRRRDLNSREKAFIDV